jgi:hypothetical protein
LDKSVEEIARRKKMGRKRVLAITGIGLAALAAATQTETFEDLREDFARQVYCESESPESVTVHSPRAEAIVRFCYGDYHAKLQVNDRDTDKYFTVVQGELQPKEREGDSRHKAGDKITDVKFDAPVESDGGPGACSVEYITVSQGEQRHDSEGYGSDRNVWLTKFPTTFYRVDVGCFYP